MKSSEIEKGHPDAVENPEELIENPEGDEISVVIDQSTPFKKWMSAGEVAGYAAMNACPKDMPIEQKYEIGKAAAFAAGGAAGLAFVEAVRRILRFIGLG
jgi:hypothetical protein